MDKQCIIYIMVIVSFFNIYGSCHKPPQNEYIDFRFEVPLSITPIKDTINAGDTLTLQADFSDLIKEVHSGNLYELKGFDFRTRIGFFKIGDTSLTLAYQPGNAGTYKIIPQTGAITDLSQTFGGVMFDSSNNRYKLKVQLIPTQRGVSSISFFSRYVGGATELNFIQLGSTAAGGRKIANLRNIWYIINNGNTNFDLYKKNSKLGNLNLIDERNYAMEATFTFVVK